MAEETKAKETKKNHSLKFQFTLFFVFFIIALYSVVFITSLQQLVGITETIGIQLGYPIVDEVASIIDGDAFERLSQTLDPGDPFYEETRTRMLEIKENSSCIFLYTMAPVTDDLYLFIIDGSAPPDNLENFSPLGAEEDISAYNKIILKTMVDKTNQISSLDFATEWGWYVSVYKPILNSSGAAVGIIGCDFKAEIIYARLWSQIIRQIVLSGIFVAAGLWIYIHMVNSLNAQNTRLLELKESAESVSAALKAERDTITVMKDNLRVGFFMLNQQYVIQDQYSRALEDILGMRNIQGENFVALVAGSLKKKEVGVLREYFAIILGKSFDAKMLEDINPINEFSYINPVTGKEKVLRSSFIPIERSRGQIFILGTLEDVSKEKKLQRQLSDEGKKRGEEISIIFEIVQVKPKIFNDFIADMEYELERIGSVLKDKVLSSNIALEEIYRMVHNIKSNSDGIGLENFSGKLNRLEDEIWKIQQQENIAFEDILHISGELEELKGIKDKFRGIVDKVTAIRSAEGNDREDYLLVQSLSKLCEKTAQDYNRKVRFVTGTVDPQAVESGSRHIVKEVLMRLVQNSVINNIEPPVDRLAVGKRDTGTIRFSITADLEHIHIKVIDDGRGLDFKQIQKTAEQRKLIPEGGQDKNQLIRVFFSPEFSAGILKEEADSITAQSTELRLVRERLREVKGTIKLQSEEKKGLAVHIYIPLRG
jgi:signal transduction histidine kinase